MTDCNCPTPWDGAIPTLVLTRAKNQPPTHTEPLPEHGYRRAATQIIAARGHKPPDDYSWQATNHRWNPVPERPGPKNRPCLLSKIEPTLVAIIDTPAYSGPTGHHCTECHTNYKDQAVAQIHKPTWLTPCKNPATIRNTLTGQSLLRRDPLGVWQLNHDSTWPNGYTPHELYLHGELVRGHPLLPWAWNRHCYAIWIARAIDAGIDVGGAWNTCIRCPARRAQTAQCTIEGIYRP